MKSTGPLILVLILLLTLGGCTAAFKNLQQLSTSPAERYRQKARTYETQDDPQKALLCWEIAARLDKQNRDTQAIQALRSSLAKAAQLHFDRGAELYRAGDLNRAMTEFLTSLRLNPDLQQARDYLKEKLQHPDQTTYRVQPGDSFIKIAEDQYKDPSKAYLIAYFNGMDPKKPLLIGTEISLPAFGEAYLIPRLDIRGLLDKAQKAFERKHYPQVYALTDRIREEVPDHPKACELADAAHFEQGQALMHQKRYLAAIEQFKLVSTRFNGRDQAIAMARARINKQAVDEKLKVAREHLTNKQWAGVISVSEEILAQDPNNDEAKMMFSNASYKLGKLLLDRGETAKSIEILSRIEPSYEDTGQLLSLARARMKSQAETLYRDGVKYFINEDLEKAVKTWKKALELNPEHPKARQDMENAQRLIEKLRALDNDPEKTAQ
jgi:tetratricopeptide (TPR) repeat protein